MSQQLPGSARTPEVLVREYEAGDEQAILRAFNLVNAGVDAGFRQRSLEEWRWRFLENPAGRRIALAFDELGSVLAQYAGSPQRLRLDGVWVEVTQGIDSFSVPAARGLGHRGTFARTGRFFAERYGGLVGEGDPWMWGFPVPLARRVGERLLDYVPLRSQPLLVLDRFSRVPAGESAEELSGPSLHAHAHELQQLFLARAAGPWVLADRQASALDWRFMRHPTRSYRLGVSRSSSSELRGLAVWRTGTWEGRRVGLLCDWLAHPDAEGDLVRWAVARAEEEGVDRIVHLLPPACESFANLQELGFRVCPSSLLLVGHGFDAAYPTRFWSQHWYYTLGDTDLV
jgi:hypothetical protein